MAKLLDKLDKYEELKVSTNIKGIPLSITREGKPERVTRIYRSWHGIDDSQENQITKHYFTVRTSKGFIYDIYRPTASNCWYLGNIHE